jgi:hypothetical protein
MKIRWSKVMLEEIAETAKKLRKTGRTAGPLPSNGGCEVSLEPNGGELFTLEEFGIKKVWFRIDRLLGTTPLSEKKMLRPY